MPSAVFSAGEIVSDRYRIVRLLGEGGMGAVYEADDLEFAEPVALKTILPATTQQSIALLRFKREIQIARKVTHRNVCRIFDVGYHTRETAAQPERIAFLTMELLHGESLSGRVRRRGPLTSAEAMPIVLQLVDGLAAAHGLGIVHRDFKSANILMAGSPGNERAVITDFGLAQLTATAGEPLSSLTSTGTVLGTPAYMAPEQLEGGELTPSADIYALGCVMYELVTGCLPFTGDTPLAMAVKRLTEPAPSPRELTPELDPRWEMVILRCLERKPEQRYARVEDITVELTSKQEVATLRLSPRSREETPTVVRELTTVPQELPTLVQEVPSLEIPRPASRRRMMVLTGVLALVITAGVATRFLPREDAAPIAPPSPGRIQARTVLAILEPHNTNGGPGSAWIATALQSYLALALADDRRLRVVRPEDVALASVDLRVVSTPRPSQDTLRRLGLRLDATEVVSSDFDTGAEGRLRLTVRLRGDATTVEGNEDHLEQLALGAAAELRKRLHLPLVDTSVVNADAVSPGNRDAARAFFGGLQRLRRFDAAGARALFTEAVAADPNFAPAHFALAESCFTLGYEEEARRESKAAVELATWVPAHERQWMQARRLEMSGEWKEAAAIWSELTKAHPDAVEYGIRLAQAASAAGDGKRALEAVAALRRLPAPLANDPGIDLAEARAAEPLGDYALKERAAGRASATASTRGARFFLAQARHMEGMAAHGTGQHARALDAYASARQLFAAVGARDDAAWMINAIATLLVDQNDIEGAQKMLEEALAIQDSTGNRRNQAATLSDMAILGYRRSEFTAARRYWERALVIQRDAGDREGEAMTLNNIGSLASELGNLAEAKALFEKALALGRAVGDRWGTANTLANLSRLLLASGDLPRSRSFLDEAVTLFRGVGHQQGLVAALADSGSLRLEEGRLGEAMKELQEAESLARQAGDRPAAARARVLIARTQLERGELASCATSIAEGIALAAEVGDKAMQAEGAVIEGECLRARGDRDGASKALARGLALREEIGDELGAARTRIALASLALDSSNAASAKLLASSARDVCRTRQAALEQARAEIVLVRAEVSLGNPAAALLTSRRASALLERNPSPLLAGSAELASAMVDAAEGRTLQASRRAGAVLDAARANGLLRTCHEALNVLARIPGADMPVSFERELVARGFAPASRR